MHFDDVELLSLDSGQANTLIVRELRIIRELLEHLVDRRMGPATAAAERQRRRRSRLKAQGAKILHGRVISPRSGPPLQAVPSVTPSVTPGAPARSDSVQVPSNTAKYAVTHTEKGVTGNVTPTEQKDRVCVSGFLEALAPASPPLVLLTDGATREKIEKILDELSEQGVLLADYSALAQWVLHGGRDGRGGLAWHNLSPPDVAYLARPGVLARLVEQARRWSRTQRAAARVKLAVPRPATRVDLAAIAALKERARAHVEAREAPVAVAPVEE